MPGNMINKDMDVTKEQSFETFMIQALMLFFPHVCLYIAGFFLAFNFFGGCQNKFLSRQSRI